MTGRKPSIYWMICWKYLSPLAMTVILIASFVSMKDGIEYKAWDKDAGDTEEIGYPWWAVILIVFLIGISALWIPINAILRQIIYEICI